jgi:hypothetical protein
VLCRIWPAKEGRMRGVGVDPKEECSWKEEGSLIRGVGVKE